jgi:hypothetical protein
MAVQAADFAVHRLASHGAPTSSRVREGACRGVGAPRALLPRRARIPTLHERCSLISPKHCARHHSGRRGQHSRPVTSTRSKNGLELTTSMVRWPHPGR